MSILPSEGISFDITVPVLIIGAGACGLTAALRAHDSGVAVLVVERDHAPTGSTALSSGMIPACETKLQAAKGIADSSSLMVKDLVNKAKGQANPEMVDLVCQTSGRAIDWLVDRYEVEMELVEGFLYPGHSVPRMYAPPSKTGAALMASLLAAVERVEIDIMTDATVTDLIADPDGCVRGIIVTRPDGSRERIGCKTLILACNGFGGNRDMIRRYIPEMADALYFGHAGNQGDAIIWGEALGGEAEHMGAYQGHGSVATSHGILITWALMMEGGIQVNLGGERFSNENQGYSEQSVAVLSQDEGLAWCVFDQRLHDLGLTFEDYRNAEAQGAVRSAQTVEKLAEIMKVPVDRLASSIAETGREDIDRYGRDFSVTPALEPPFYAVKVTGALFHTQGGLRINRHARVLRRANNDPLPNLFAGGGAACGVSGPEVSGYLSGNGLLTAVTLGLVSGEQAAIQVLRETET